MLFSLFSSGLNQNTEPKSKALLDILMYVDVLSWSVLSPSPSHQCGSPTLVDCPLVILYVHSYSLIHENCLVVAWGRPCHPLDTGNIFSVGETFHCLFIRSLKISSLSVYLFRMLANISAITLAGKGQLSFQLINGKALQKPDLPGWWENRTQNCSEFTLYKQCFMIKWLGLFVSKSCNFRTMAPRWGGFGIVSPFR